MRHLAAFFGAALVCTLASVALGQQPVQQPVQQPLKFNVGDSVEVYTFGRWVPCKVSSPINFGTYGVHCGTIDMSAKAVAAELRAVVPTDPNVRQVAVVAFAQSAGSDSAPPPASQSIGSRYGTREPRQCDRRNATLSSVEAKELFICDSEHEFGSTLYLVSDVSLDVSTPRPFNAKADSGKTGIDASQPVVDIHASYNNYQCSPLPYNAQDNPDTRNCNESKMTNAAGSCFKNASGDWHCMMFDFHPAATATANNVRPPTRVY